MLTNAAVFQDLLGYFGAEELAHLTPDQPQQICNALNAALQLMWSKGPHWLRQGRDSGALFAPITLSGLTLTRGTKTIAGAGITSAMIGQSIVIAGENQAALNEITSLTTVLNPTFQANTVNATATVYTNAIVLAPGVQAVATRVVMDGQWELTPAERKERDRNWSNWFWLNNDYGFRGARGMIDNRVGCPSIYWVESMITQTTGVRQQRLCVYPMPSKDRLIEYECTYSAPSVTLSALLPAANSGTGDTAYIPIPEGYHESILLPIARAELTALPNFQSSKVPLVQAGAAKALNILDALEPQEQGGVDLKPQYGYCS